MAATVSLKSLIPDLAPAFHMTTAALYERQRALVRAGLLKAKSGKGPGSGVKGTPQSLALLLISVLATESLSEVELSTRRAARLPASDGTCPLTGKKTFGRALEAILACPKMTTYTDSIETLRDQASASIHWYDWATQEKKSSYFQLMEWNPGVLIVEASLGRPFPLVRIANLIAETFEEWWRDQSTEDVKRVLGARSHGMNAEEYADRLREEMSAEAEEGKWISRARDLASG